MANLTLRYLDELSYVLNSRRHLANQAKASSVGDLLNAEEERFTPVMVKRSVKLLLTKPPPRSLFCSMTKNHPGSFFCFKPRACAAPLAQWPGNWLPCNMSRLRHPHGTTSSSSAYKPTAEQRPLLTRRRLGLFLVSSHPDKEQGSACDSSGAAGFQGSENRLPSGDPSARLSPLHKNDVVMTLQMAVFLGFDDT
ncbi:unnamed protein product [Spodoptera exigua]|nr:unnamed protein product [Spodoptera exigua]